MAAGIHEPVLLDAVLDALAWRADGTYVDATVGLGGHAAALLRRLPDARLFGLDVDGQALAIASDRLAPFGDRVTLVRSSYTHLADVLDSLRVAEIDGVLFDLGVSSLQLDTADRGFSFRHDGPLDMRFSGEGMSAEELLRDASEADLARIIRDFGEEPRARRIARFIVNARTTAPIRTTAQLQRLVASALGGRRGRTDPATRTFQALRIAVNQELEGIPGAIEGAARRLRHRGRLAAISFHSLEDRLVKRTLLHLSGRCVCPPGTPMCHCDPENLLRVLTRRPLVADENETDRNPRARSAKLRVAERSEP